MDGFLVSPDDCLILRAVKEKRTLREAAALLKCDPAGLARKIKHLSDTTGLIQKVDNRWIVATRGLDLIAWAEDAIENQKRIVESKSSIRIGATAWLSESVLIPNLKELKASLGENSSLALSIPYTGFESALIDGSIDFVVACHPPENPEIEHRQIGIEEWMLITPIAWKLKLTGNPDRQLQKLWELPFVAHHGLNLEKFFPDMPAVKAADYSFDNLIGVRTAVISGLGWSFVPRMLIDREAKDQKLFKIRTQTEMRDRRVCLWWLRNRASSKRLSNHISNWLKGAVH